MNLYLESDRRRTPRIEVPFLALVRGVDVNGWPFELETALDNLSADGIYMRLVRDIECGADLELIVHFTASPLSKVSVPQILIRGTVSRIEPKLGGAWGVALVIKRYRYL